MGRTCASLALTSIDCPVPSHNIDVSSNDLFDFMRTVTRDMADEYECIQKLAGEDPGTVGDQNEEN